MNQLSAVLAEIALIDRKSDGVSRALFCRTRISIFDAGSWQLGWDRNPDLLARRDALHEPRWAAMERRDAILAQQSRAAERSKRAAYRTELVRCSACGEYSRVACSKTGAVQ